MITAPAAARNTLMVLLVVIVAAAESSSGNAAADARANRWTGRGGDYLPSPSSEDQGLQATLTEVLKSAPTVGRKAPAATPAAAMEQQQQPLCELVNERRTTSISSDGIVYTCFDLITLALLLASVFVTIYALRCIMSLRIVSAGRQKSHQN